MSLLLRPAKLIVAGHEIPCILRKLTDSELTVGLFFPLAPGPMEFELPDGIRVPVALTRIEGNIATLTLSEPLSPTALRRDWSKFPQRQLRLSVRMDALLHVRETVAPVSILNISASGAKIECAIWLRLDEPIKIVAKNLPALYAWVRWRNYPEYGIVSDLSFRLEEIALLCAPQQVCTLLHKGLSG